MEIKTYYAVGSCGGIIECDTYEDAEKAFRYTHAIFDDFEAARNCSDSLKKSDDTMYKNTQELLDRVWK